MFSSLSLSPSEKKQNLAILPVIFFGMVSSRDPNSMAVNVTNPTFGDKIGHGLKHLELGAFLKVAFMKKNLKSHEC